MKNLLKVIAWKLFPKHLAKRYLSHTVGEEIEESIISLFLDKQTECVDVGANRGRYTVLMSLFSKHIHAFEPNPECLTILRELSLPKTSVYPHALSNTEGFAQYFLPIRDGKRFSIWGTLEAAVSKNHDEIDTFEVATHTLNELRDHKISFVKIDVEGHELNVLEGGCELIKQQQPIFMVEAEERHRQKAIQSIQDFFRQFDYQGFFILDKQIQPIEEFDLALQDIQELQRSVPRKEMHYINNFIFVPPSADLQTLVQQLNHKLESVWRSPVLQ